MQNLRTQLENDYNNFNYSTGYAYEAAIHDIEATNARIMAYIKGAEEDAETKRLSELQRNRRNNKELLFNAAQRVSKVLIWGRRIVQGG
jgi:hypothetical protein